MTAVAATLGAVALAGCGGSGIPHGGFSLPCNPQPEGALCLKAFSYSGKAREVIAYFSASASPLTGKTWRLALTYGRAASVPTIPQHGNPPEETFCKDSNGQTVTTVSGFSGCDDTLAEFRASLGDFPGFDMPMASLPNPLCVREQVQKHGKWVAGPAKPDCVST